MLLEDQQIVRDYLVLALGSKSYTVTAVENGVEGIREIQANDFDVILCDMMMPKLAGDMFYFAVERMKPQLCKRFIFMTGFKNDTRIHTFIKKVNGLILGKPFKVDELMEMISFLQVHAHLDG